MRTYYIPSLITLSAGAVYCLVAIRNHLTLRETLTELLIVVIVFYLAGSVVKFIIDRNFKDMELDAAKNFYKKPTIPKEVSAYKEVIDPGELLQDITLRQLNDIFKSVMKKQVDKIDPIRSKFGTIEKEEINIEDRMFQIREEVKGLKGINFRTLLESQPSRMNIIITFMSILELMKIGAIVIRQEKTFGDIVIDSLDEIDAVITPMTRAGEEQGEPAAVSDDGMDETSETDIN